MISSPPNAHFDINPAVVFRLGEELITDVVQALLELVKNSYDADATWVNVVVDTHEIRFWGRENRKTIGSIRIEDNGHGMDRNTIEQGWLTIAKSPKRKMKDAGQTTARGRTPIGEKGLGRLGSQRLASNVEIKTRHVSDPRIQHVVSFSWDDFRTADRFDDVTVTWRQNDVKDRRSGTSLVLSGLCDLESWQTKQSLVDLQRRLSGLISPFEGVGDFRVHLKVDGESLGLTRIAAKVRDSALLRYKFHFDGNLFRIVGMAKLAYLRPGDKDSRHWFNAICRRDGGKALFEFLATQTAAGHRPREFTLSRGRQWFVRFGEQWALDGLDGVRTANGSLANPGPFHGEVDSMVLDRADLTGRLFDGQSEYRALVQKLAGIRVYRDGFGVRVGSDWLGLGKQWTGASSYYGLRPGNVLGYVAITAKDNADLVETTSREGFQVNPHYENFVNLLSTFVEFAGKSQGYLRRGVLNFLDEHRDRRVGVEPDDRYGTITQRLDAIAVGMVADDGRVGEMAGAIDTIVAVANRIAANVDRGLSSPVDANSPVAEALRDVKSEADKALSILEHAVTVLDEMSGALENAKELRGIREVLDRRWTARDQEMEVLYESVSLGLTAEALAHEIHNIAGRLAQKSAILLRRIDRGVSNGAVVTYVEHVRSSVVAMRKQLSHLTPSLRYLREKKERIEIGLWLQSLASFHNANLRKKGITIEVVESGSSGYEITMNKGKLTQVFDNLIFNAEYWLQEAMRRGIVANGVITLVVERPVVKVMDNGRGIDEAVEETLFDPFVTMKRRGRGLGLFVVRQLLGSESCGAVLLPERNEFDRRYVFEIDLEGALSG